MPDNVVLGPPYGALPPVGVPERLVCAQDQLLACGCLWGAGALPSSGCLLGRGRGWRGNPVWQDGVCRSSHECQGSMLCSDTVSWHCRWESRCSTVCYASSPHAMQLMAGCSISSRLSTPISESRRIRRAWPATWMAHEQDNRSSCTAHLCTIHWCHRWLCMSESHRW